MKVGERLKNVVGDPARRWSRLTWGFSSGVAFRDDESADHPPSLAPGKDWLFLASSDAYHSNAVVERRALHPDLRSGNAAVPVLHACVVVFREGLALPTTDLLHVVNTAHAVLVVRGAEEYFYLRDDFVLSTCEEESLVEWGVGRPLLANSFLAVGGALLVALVEKVWGPAVVGTVIVAAAGYRVQGAMTKLMRVRSPEWERNLLVPSGIHGTERVVQIVLVTLVALADLLDHRVLLLTALVIASAQVLVLEIAGQTCLTWGLATYRQTLYHQVCELTVVFVGLVAWLWLTYAFAGYFGAVLFGGLILISYEVSYVLCAGANTSYSLRDRSRAITVTVFVVASVVSNGVGIYAAVLSWDETNLKLSPKSLQPWRWPLTRAPDSFASGLRVLGLWAGAVVGSFIAVYVAVLLLSFRIGSDGGKVVGLGKRTRERERAGVFSHYHESSIPSRNLLVADVCQPPQPSRVAFIA